MSPSSLLIHAKRKDFTIVAKLIKFSPLPPEADIQLFSLFCLFCFSIEKRRVVFGQF